MTQRAIVGESDAAPDGRPGVTGRDQAQQALEASEGRFRAALETMLDSVVMTTAVRDGDGHIVDFVVDYINPVAEIGQRSAGEIVGRRFLDVWPSAPDSALWEMYLRLVETGEPIVLDNFTYTELIDGRPVTAVYDIRATRLGDGFLQNFRDVTERHQTQQALEASEKRFRSAVDALPYTFIIFGPVRDCQGRIVELEYRYVNQVLLRLYNRSWEEVVGHGVLELFPSVGELGLFDRYVEAIETHSPATIDLPWFDEHGVAGSFEVTVTPSDEEVVVASRDVTAQRQAAQYARSLIEASLDPLVTISADGKITDVNEATVEVTGVSRDELLGTDFSDYFTEPDKARTAYQQVFAEGSVTDYPLTFRGDKLSDVVYNASLYKGRAGKPLGVFAAARDVTAQKQAEAEIAKQRAMELERLDELERFQRLTVGRELKMIELKKEIEALRKEIEELKKTGIGNAS
ncbi:MAG TPA: PAS domain-containing protein [Streptosporangiaceae bacterium]|nr:PAS domain-containing protein [Streptosporangiaceae bacterium]